MLIYRFWLYMAFYSAAVALMGTFISALAGNTLGFMKMIFPGFLGGLGLWNWLHKAEEPLWRNSGIGWPERLGTTFVLLPGLALLAWCWLEGRISPELGGGIGAAIVGGLLLFHVWLLLQAQERSPLDVRQLEADGFFQHFGARAVLKGAWLNCQKGEIVALLGRNGSGKSTLLQRIYGLMVPESGNVRIDQLWVAKPWRIDGLMAFLPQQGYLPREWSVKHALRWGSPYADVREQLCQDPIIARVLRQRIGQLSTGERRYLELHLLLARQPAFLLLDEPFAGVDPLHREFLRKSLIAARATCGIVLTDHAWHEVMQVATRMILLRGGQCETVEDWAALMRLGYLPSTADLTLQE
jgi:ABC-type multidrug transport system ATPase subunit